MPRIVITNVSPGALSLDIPLPFGAGVGHPKTICRRLGVGENIDVGDTTTVDDLNRTIEFQRLLATGLISVQVSPEPSDLEDASLEAGIDRTAIVNPTTGNNATGAYGTVLAFQTISGALAAAPPLLPTAANPLVILIAPGIYVEPLTLVSNVHLASLTGKRRSVVQVGAVTWTPGAGPNVVQAGAREWATLNGMAVDAISTDATAKTADVSVLEMRDCGGNGITAIGRIPGGNDYVQIFDSIIFGGGPITLTSVWGNIYHSFILALTVAGAGGTTVQGWQVWGAVTIGGTAAVDIMQTLCVGSVTVGPGASLVGAASLFTSTLSTAALGSIDVRGAEVRSPAQFLAGGGGIDRTLYRFALATGAGPNIIAFAVPYATTTYDVLITENAGPGGGPTVTVTGKTPAGFTLNDPAGGRSFDITIVMQ